MSRDYLAMRCAFGCILICFSLVVVRSVGAQVADRDRDNATTVQLPTLGVSIDADGVLNFKSNVDPTGALRAARVQAARQTLGDDIAQSSPMRKISLRRLEKSIENRIARGKPLSDEMRFLAGLNRVEYVFVCPDQNDIIIAGPAEGWMDDGVGRTVGIDSGTPTILLEDLMVALRVFFGNQREQPNGNPWIACSIDPTQEGLKRLKEFQKSIPDRVPMQARAQAAVQLASGLQESLGNARIRIHGVSNKSHMAQVLVEADYRMKTIGIGLEPPPIRMTTFIGALKRAPRRMQSWWLTPNYECVSVADDGLAARLVGRGVKLSTDVLSFEMQGKQLTTKQKPSSASRRYADSFTKKFEKIAAARPVFHQLRTMMDLLIVFSWLHRENATERIDWKPGLLLDEQRLPTQTCLVPERVACVANAVWKQHVLLLPVGGGVSISPHLALDSKVLKPDKNGEIREQKTKVVDESEANAADKWWWD